MRSNFVALFSLGFLLVLIAGSAFLPASASTIEATVVLDPEKINLGTTSGWSSPYMIATITFPKPFKDQLININASTVLLDGTVPLSWYDSSPGKYKAFFDRGAVIDYLWLKVTHMGCVEPFKNIPVVLTVTGNLYDGTPFAGSDTVFVSAK